MLRRPVLVAGNEASARVIVVASAMPAKVSLVKALGRGKLAVQGFASAGEARSEVDGSVAIVVVDPLVDVDAIDFLRSVTRKRSTLPVVAVVSRGDNQRVIAAIRAGARGCLYVDEAPDGILAAVREAVDGGRPMSNGMAPLFLEHIRASARRSSVGRPAARPLTERERAVLGHMARGLSYEDTGIALGVSVNTVRTYVRAIYEKLDVASRTEAVLLGMKLGIVTSNS